MNIAQARFELEKQGIHDIFWEYLQWANGRNDEEFGIWLDIESMIKDNMATLDKFGPPLGRLLLACVKWSHCRGQTPLRPPCRLCST